MLTAQLTLNFLEILIRKERWELYFILLTEHPDEIDRTIITLIPENGTIPMRKAADNFYSFKPEGEGADGLIIHFCNVEPGHLIKARLFMMHSRKTVRKAGTVMDELTDIFKVKGLGFNPVKLIKNISLQTFLIEKGLNVIETLLKGTKDRNLGFVTLDERFGKEFDKNPCQERTNKLSTGNAKIKWEWELL